MKDCLEASKCLASLAVFRELYNSEKDIYGIICEFLKEVISSNGKHQFTLTEIAQLLNDTYDFKIPDAVVRTSLSRFKDSLVRSGGLYTITKQSAFTVTGKLTGSHASIKHTNDLIIQKLFKFIEEERKAKISDKEKENIVHSFCSFILDESTVHEYSEYVSAFILKSREDHAFTSQLNTIKEGIVLYTGLKYNPSLNDLGSWNTELTIYIETVLLFDLAGFNGQLFQTLFDDFFSLVKEINSTSHKKRGKKLIRLKYFTEIKDEIERFFKKAEYIVSGKDKAQPSRTAMTSIIDGCKTPAEIIEKKIRFFEMLKANSILEDDHANYYAIPNHKFNIEDQELLKAFSKKIGAEIKYISTSLKYLNYINIHRKGLSDKVFESIGCVLLSGSAITLRLAWDESLKENGSVPLASHINFFTNRFWFRLNKGFGKSTFPKIFDIVTKAQIVLSTQLNDSVADKFDDLQIKFKNGKLTEPQAVACIAELRRQVKKPEEISEYDVDNVLKSIRESNIEQYLQEQDLLRSKAQKQEEENTKLKEALIEKQQEMDQQNKEYQEAFKRSENENKRKEAELERFREEQRVTNKAKAKHNRLVKIFLIISVFIVYTIVGVEFYIYLNRVLGIITGTIAGIFTILSFFRIDYKSILRLFGKE